ncbi:hypothetical protein ACTFIV_008704 [Dictyostelium citrinum]
MGQGNSKLSSDDIKKIMSKTNYTNEQVNQILKDYQSVNQDSKGLSLEEFKSFFSIRFKDYDDASILQMFKIFDSDKNGRISFKEFVGALFIITKSPVSDKLSFLFDMFDRDLNGYLDLEESYNILKLALNTSVGLGFDVSQAGSFAESLLNSMNRNSHGGITKEEFIKKASVNDTFVRMLCFYQSYDTLLY